MLNGDALELQRNAVPLLNEIREARRKAKARLLYEPALSNVASAFMARVLSGKASTSDTQDRPANEFLHDKPENAELVKRLLRAGNSEHYDDPQQFVDAADDNYALRQGTPNCDSWGQRCDLLCWKIANTCCLTALAQATHPTCRTRG